MEPVHPRAGYYEDPRTQDDCRICGDSACDGEGYVPGGERLPEDACCGCGECHPATLTARATVLPKPMLDCECGFCVKMDCCQGIIYGFDANGSETDEKCPCDSHKENSASSEAV